MEERRTVKFGLAFSPSERAALDKLAHDERLTAAAVVRRLVWLEAKERGLLSNAGSGQRRLAGQTQQS